jgi:phosphoglucomutase
MVASTVSSKMIEYIGKVEGFKFVECLTGLCWPLCRAQSSDADLGFKYIGNVGLQLVEQNFVVPFGYEEAIGFMVETGIRDKDGVSATVRTCPSASLILRVTGTHPGLYSFAYFYF